MQRITLFFRYLVITVIALYTLGYLAWRGLLVSPLYAEYWQLQVSEVFWAWAYLPLVPLAILALLVRHRWAYLSLAIPLAFFMWEYGAQFLPNWQNSIALPAAYAQNNSGEQEGAVQTAASELKVMTWNSFRSYKIHDDFATVLQEQRPDIVTIQEASSGLRRNLQNEYGDLYPYQYHQLYGSLVTISRFPLSKPTYNRLMQMGCRCLPLELEWNGRKLTVINIHIPRPTVIYDVRRGIPTITTFDTRAQELHYRVLFKMLDQIEGPLLLQGDINTTERQPNFRRLTKTLKDSFAEVGWGMGFTYPNVEKGPSWLIPLVQIDHILHSKELVALTADTGKISSSDHLYVTATLRWR